MKKKKTIDNARFFTFFTTLDLIWPKFFPKTTTILEDSININNFNWNPAVLKKIC